MDHLAYSSLLLIFKITLYQFVFVFRGNRFDEIGLNFKSITIEMDNSNRTKLDSSMPKLMIFKLIQKNFKVVGIESSLVEQKYPFNRKILVGFLMVSISFLWNVMSTLYEAKTFVEYTQLIYMCSLAALIILALAIVLFNVVKMFSLIDKGEYLTNLCEFLRFIF